MKKEKSGTSSATVYYLRGANGDVLAEYDGAGALDRKYVYSGANKLAYIKQDTTHFYLADHLGSTRVVLRSDGAIPARYDYWPFGETLEQTADATRWLFTGHERDFESGLDNMHWREYDGFTHRFSQIDPMAGKYPGMSPYAYAASNPVKFVDPDGRQQRPARYTPPTEKDEDKNKPKYVIEGMPRPTGTMPGQNASSGPAGTASNAGPNMSRPGRPGISITRLML